MVKYINGLVSDGTTWLESEGNTVASASTLYVAPKSTTFSGVNNYLFSYFATPITSGSTTGIASTLFIQGAPANATTAYALNVASGTTLLGGNVNISGITTFSGGVLASGANNIDYSGSSGTFKTSTGAVTIGNGEISMTGRTSFITVGSYVPQWSPLYIAPSSTSTDNTLPLYFTYFDNPIVTLGTQTTSIASTVYINGAPIGTGVTTKYALQVASDNSLFNGNVNISQFLTLTNTSPSNNSTSGALRCAGGAYFGNRCIFDNNNTFNGQNVFSVNIQLYGSVSSAPFATTFYVYPINNTFSGNNNYYFTYFEGPQAPIGTTTGIAATVLINGAPSGASLNYALLVGGLVQFNSNFRLIETAASISSSTGALQCAGGAYFGNDSIMNANLTLQGASSILALSGASSVLTLANTAGSTSSITGALRCAGGAYFGANSIMNANLTLQGASSILALSGASSVLTLANTAGSISSITGALRCAGGAYFGNTSTFGGSVLFNGSTAFTGTASLSIGCNVISQITMTSFDLSGSSGTFQTPTGANTISGALTCNSSISMIGSGNMDFTGSSGFLRYRNRFSCRITRDSVQTITSAGAFKQITSMNTTTDGYDTNGNMATPANSITIQQTGIYSIAVAGFSMTNISIYFSWRVRKDGSDFLAQLLYGGTTDDSFVNINAVRKLNANEVLTVYCFQDSGSDKNVSGNTNTSRISLTVTYLGEV